MMTLLFIYALRDPEDGRVCYVGKTNRLKARLKHHMYCGQRRHNSELFDWIKGLMEQDSRPLITVLSVCDEEEWNKAEKDWIDYFRKSDVPLYNIATGGRGPNIGQRRKMSEKVKDRLREARAKQLADPEYQERHRTGVNRWLSSLSTEERERLAGVGRAELSKHRKAEWRTKQAKDRWDSMTPQQKLEFCDRRAARSNEVYPAESRSQNSKNRWANMTLEQREHYAMKLREALRIRWDRQRANA